jgi:hypothetical protein
MNPYIPKDNIYPKVGPEPSFWVLQHYVKLMGNAPYRLMRPAFVLDYPTYTRSQYELDHSKRMKMNEAMVVILTGVKTRDTRIYMEGFISFIRERQWVCINRMEIDYHEEWMRREEYKDDSDSAKRYKALRLKANTHRRITLAYIVSQSIPLTRENWENSWKHVYSRNIAEYIQLIEAAIALPKEWSDDEYLNDIK